MYECVLIQLFLSTLTAGSGWVPGGKGLSFGKNQEYLLSGFVSYIGNYLELYITESKEKGISPLCQREVLKLANLAVKADV
jgi:hypothetical protein